MPKAADLGEAKKNGSSLTCQVTIYVCKSFPGLYACSGRTPTAKVCVQPSRCVSGGSRVYSGARRTVCLTACDCAWAALGDLAQSGARHVILR